MKKHIYLFSFVLALSVFSSVSAKADILGGLLGGLLGGGNPPANNQPATLPIDNNITFLTIAGVVFGVVTIKKAKKSSIALQG